jgi:D-amino-acid dehydrogenase
VGPTRYRNLWLNTGHGTLGWTLGAGSGKRIVDMMTASATNRSRVGVEERSVRLGCPG